MTEKEIQKYSKFTVAALKRIAVKHFHKFIRERDKDKHCVSCGRFTTLQAGHFHSAGRCERLRFNENNIHGQCLKCNFYEQQSDTNYRKEIEKRIGKERLSVIDFIASIKTPYKTDRFFLVEIILKYK